MIEPRLRFKADDGSDFPDWEEKRLEDVVEFLDEKRKPLEAGKRVAGKYPYYGASGIIDYVEDYIFDEELILLSEDGANILDRNYRVCFLAKGKYWVNNHAHVMKAKKGNLNYFICEELETFDYRKYNSGGAQPKLNQASCRSIVVKIPSLPEQQKIADFLSTIDTIIEKQRATVSAWEERKKGVMQKLFSQEVRFKADDGSDFPDWEEKEVKDVCSVSTGKSNTQDKVDSGKYEFYVRSPIVEHSDKYLFDEEAVITVGDGVGTGKVFHYVNGKYNLHQRCYRMYDFMGVIGKYFFYFFSQNFYRRIKAMSAKTSVDSVRMEMITKMKMNVPSLPEQQKIADCLSALDTVIEKQKETLEKWQELKKGLLQQMFV